MAKRNNVARGMILSGTGKGKVMRDRRSRRPEDAKNSWERDEAYWTNAFRKWIKYNLLPPEARLFSWYGEWSEGKEFLRYECPKCKAGTLTWRGNEKCGGCDAVARHDD